MERTIVITLLSIIYATPLCAMDVAIDRKTENDLSQGLILLSAGQREAALEFFF